MNAERPDHRSSLIVHRSAFLLAALLLALSLQPSAFSPSASAQTPPVVGPATVIEWDPVEGIDGYQLWFAPTAEALRDARSPDRRVALTGMSASMKLGNLGLADGPWCFAPEAYRSGPGGSGLSDEMVCVDYRPHVGLPPKPADLRLKMILEVPIPAGQ